MPELIRFAPRETRISVIDRFRESWRSFWRPGLPLTAFKGELGALYGYSGDDYAAGIYGSAVNHNTAFTFSAVYDAVNQISSDVAKLPLNLRKYRQAGGSDVYDASETHWLFKRAANPETKAFDFRRTLTAHALTCHGGFAEIQRDGFGRPRALWVITPDRIVPYRDRLPKGGYGPLRYKVDGERLLRPEDVLHIRGLGYDGTMGYDVISLARKAIGLALSAENYGSTLFQQGTYGGVLNTEDDLDPDQQLAVRAEINKYKSGFQQFLTLFNRKWTYQRTTASSTDVGLERTREQQIEDVARFFNIPLYKLKVAKPGAMSYASVEANSVDYLTGCLLNWLLQWETELNFKLVPNLEKRQQFFKHNTAAIVRGDIKSRYDAYAVLLNLGVLSADEVRELEDMNPQDKGQGGMYLVQGALVPKDKIEAQVQSQIDKNNQPPPAPPAAQDDDRTRELRARAERAEQAAKDALEQAARLRAQIEVFEVVGAADKQTIEALRESERQSLSLAATLTEQSQSLRLEYQTQIAAIEAQRETEAKERARLAADLDAARTAAAEAAARIEDAQQARKNAELALQTAIGCEAEARAHETTARQLADVAIAERDRQVALTEEAQRQAQSEREAAERQFAKANATETARAEALQKTEEAERRAEEFRDRLAVEERIAAEIAEKAEAAAARADAAEGARQAIAGELESLRGVEAEARAALARAEEALTAAQGETAKVQRERDEALEILAQQQTETASEREKRTAAETAIALRYEPELTAAERRVEEARAAGAEALANTQAELDAIRADRDRLIAADAESRTMAKNIGDLLDRECLAHQATKDRHTAEWNESLARRQAERQEASLATASLIAAHRELVVHTMTLMIEREADRARRAQGSPDKFSRWMETFYDGHEELLRAALLPAVRVHLAFVRSDESAVEMTRRLVAGHIDESRRQLLTVLDGDADALAASVAGLLHRWQTERIATIADLLMQKELDYVRNR